MTTVAEQQKRVSVIARPEGEVAGDVDDPRALSERRLQALCGERLIEQNTSGQHAARGGRRLIVEDRAQLLRHGRQRVEARLRLRHAETRSLPLRGRLVLQTRLAGERENDVTIILN